MEHFQRFAELDHLVRVRTPERDVYLAKAVAEVRSALSSLNIEAEVTGRGKHLWSIYEKMVVKGLEFDYVVIVECNAATFPVDSETRHLLHIAATRAAHQLWVFSTGTPSLLLPESLVRASD